MGMPEGWPDRPAFGRFRMVTVEKPDGRLVHYYDWPGEADADDREEADASSSGDARRDPTGNGGV